jgi:type I restriction enzyme, S subunit
VTNQQINSIIVDDAEFDARFVYYTLSADQMRIRAIASGSATPIISKSAFEQWVISVPPIVIQRAVADVLGALDDKIDCNQKIARFSERLAVALLGSNPKRVPVKTLAEIEHTQLKVSEFESREVDHFSLPAFDATGLPDRSAGSSIKSNKFQLLGPVVLVSKLNPHIPRVWHAVPTSEVLALASTEFVVLRPREEITSQELWASCAASTFTARLAERVVGTTGSHQRVRPADILETSVVDLRRLADTTRLAVREMVNRAAAARLESVCLTRLRNTLLPQLLSGGLRVRDVEPHLGEAV